MSVDYSNSMEILDRITSIATKNNVSPCSVAIAWKYLTDSISIKNVLDDSRKKSNNFIVDTTNNHTDTIKITNGTERKNVVNSYINIVNNFNNDILFQKNLGCDNDNRRSHFAKFLNKTYKRVDINDYRFFNTGIYKTFYMTHNKVGDAFRFEYKFNVRKIDYKNLDTLIQNLKNDPEVLAIAKNIRSTKSSISVESLDLNIDNAKDSIVKFGNIILSYISHN